MRCPLIGNARDGRDTTHHVVVADVNRPLIMLGHKLHLGALLPVKISILTMGMLQGPNKVL